MNLRITALWIALVIPAYALAEDGKKPDAPAGAASAAADAEGDALFKQLKEMQPPALDAARRRDQKYIQEWMKENEEWAKERAKLAKEFLEKHPDHAHKIDVLFIHVESLGRLDAGSNEFVETVKTFLKAAPDDPRGAIMLYSLANIETDEAAKSKLLHEIVDKFPKSDTATMVKGQLRQVDGVGKPFELAFTEAISGKKISMADLKGKVVVVDFWATWCGPCVAEMPHMKELYTNFKDKGVEFIGISLDAPEDQEGLKKLKAFVKKNEIPWPQFYQGNGWESEFSRGWGINSIPALFVVDADGKLHSTAARGQLEKMIPELLDKAGEAKPGKEK